jgi:hypothetical protein
MVMLQVHALLLSTHRVVGLSSGWVGEWRVGVGCYQGHCCVVPFVHVYVSTCDLQRQGWSRQCVDPSVVATHPAATFAAGCGPQPPQHTHTHNTHRATLTPAWLHHMPPGKHVCTCEWGCISGAETGSVWLSSFAARPRASLPVHAEQACRAAACSKGGPSLWCSRLVPAGLCDGITWRAGEGGGGGAGM